jgi:hypothetical protein
VQALLFLGCTLYLFLCSTGTPLLGRDVNDDGEVDINDLLILIAA